MFWHFFLIMWVTNIVRAGISFHNVRRAPVIFRHSRYEERETRPDSSELREKNDNLSSQDKLLIPPVRRRASMQERLLRGLSKFIPRLPSFSSLNLIKRTGGFRRFPRPPAGSDRGEPQGQADGEYNEGPKLQFQHRLGGNPPATIDESTYVPDNFQTQINEFRTGLLVSDPRINYFKIPKQSERRTSLSNDRDQRLESDLRSNMVKRAEANRRRHRPDPSDPKISHLAGPPYPGPHPRNPRLPLDKTIIFP